MPKHADASTSWSQMLLGAARTLLSSELCSKLCSQEPAWHPLLEPLCTVRVLASGPTRLQELGTSKEQQANGSKGPATIAVGQQVEPFISGTFEYGLGRPASRVTCWSALCIHGTALGLGLVLPLVDRALSAGWAAT